MTNVKNALNYKCTDHSVIVKHTKLLLVIFGRVGGLSVRGLSMLGVCIECQGGDYAWLGGGVGGRGGRGPYMVLVCIECQVGDYACGGGGRGREGRTIHGAGM